MGIKGRLKGNVQICSVFGRLTVWDGPIYANASGKPSGAHWDCVCSCGKKCRVGHHNLVKGHTQSCGCYQLEKIREALFKHGESGLAGDRSSASSEWIAWLSMKDRCLNPKNDAYAYYGGRGITVCERWRNSYVDFLSDVKRKPSASHSLDRIDVNGNYEPGNCQWATSIEQAGNKSNNVNLTLDGETHCVAEWCRRTGLNEHLIRKRIRKGWSHERALTTPRSVSARRRYDLEPATV